MVYKRWIIALLILFAGLTMITPQPAHGYTYNSTYTFRAEATETVYINHSYDYSSWSNLQTIDVEQGNTYSIFLNHPGWWRIEGNVSGVYDEFYVRKTIQMRTFYFDVKAPSGNPMTFEITLEDFPIWYFSWEMNDVAMYVGATEVPFKVKSISDADDTGADVTILVELPYRSGPVTQVVAKGGDGTARGKHNPSNYDFEQKVSYLGDLLYFGIADQDKGGLYDSVHDDLWVFNQWKEPTSPLGSGKIYGRVNGDATTDEHIINIDAQTKTYLYMYSDVYWTNGAGTDDGSSQIIVRIRDDSETIVMETYYDYYSNAVKLRYYDNGGQTSASINDNYEWEPTIAIAKVYSTSGYLSVNQNETINSDGGYIYYSPSSFYDLDIIIGTSYIHSIIIFESDCSYSTTDIINNNIYPPTTVQNLKFEPAKNTVNIFLTGSFMEGQPVKIAIVSGINDEYYVSIRNATTELYNYSFTGTSWEGEVYLNSGNYQVRVYQQGSLVAMVSFRVEKVTPIVKLGDIVKSYVPYGQSGINVVLILVGLVLGAGVYAMTGNKGLGITAFLGCVSVLPWGVGLTIVTVIGIFAYLGIRFAAGGGDV